MSYDHCCDRCSGLIAPFEDEAMVFSPAEELEMVRKYRLCGKCWKAVKRTIQELKRRAMQPTTPTGDRAG